MILGISTGVFVDEISTDIGRLCMWVRGIPSVDSLDRTEKANAAPGGESSSCLKNFTWGHQLLPASGCNLKHHLSLGLALASLWTGTELPL